MLKILKSILLLPWKLLTWIRQTLANLILLVLIILGLSAYLSHEQPNAAPSEGALIIAPSGAIVEQTQYVDPFTLLLQEEDTRSQETLLHDITLSIEYAADDENVTALILDNSWLTSADPSKLFSIATAIDTFKASGKPVFAVGDSFSQAQYFLASHADQIFLNPMGSVFLHGFGSYPAFYKEALDKLKVNVHIFRVGDYKSFVEPFVRNDMSAEAKQNASLWLDDIWQTFSQDMEQQRELTSGSINDYINNLDKHLLSVQGNGAQLALDKGLVDKVGNRDEMEQWIIDAIGEDLDTGSFPNIDMESYVQKVRRQNAYGDKVGVIVAKGMILDGSQDPGTIGGDSLAQQIKEAREDEDIKALVLRIDSPGGSAFAAELIRRELLLTREAGIPVIASFGGVAASGGYWIAAGADEIWSTPTTITGSIGVFGMIPTFESSFSALGIHSDGVGTTDLANAWHLDQAMNPILKSSIQLEVEHIYQRFLELVAEGRDSTPEAVHLDAQGQVWSGNTAKQKELVDQLGDLQDAIAAAADKAQLGDDYEWEFVEPALSPREQLLQQLITNQSQLLASLLPDSLLSANTVSSSTPSQGDKFKAVLHQAKTLVRGIEQFNDPKGVYSQCLECRIH